MASTLRGACLCEAVRFEVVPPTSFCGHCHCTLCQRSNSAGYVTWVGVPREQLKLISGAEILTEYRSSSHGSRSFCSVCGSSLFCQVDEHPQVIDITLANFLDPIDREPAGHVYFSDRAPWISVDEKLPRRGGATGLDPL